MCATACGPGARLGLGLWGCRRSAQGLARPPGTPGEAEEREWPGAWVSPGPPNGGDDVLPRRTPDFEAPAKRLGRGINAPRLELLRIVGKVNSNCSERGLQMIVGRCRVRRKHRLRSIKDHTSSPLRSNTELLPVEFYT